MLIVIIFWMKFSAMKNEFEGNVSVNSYDESY